MRADGRKQRRDRVRQAILRAARDLVTTEGGRSLSLRKIAQRIDYTGAAIYHYFPSKRHILSALAEDECRELRRWLDEAARDPADTVSRVRHVCWSLYEFCKRNPVLREVIVVEGASELHQCNAIGEAAARLEIDVRRCIDEGLFSGRLTPAAASRMLLLATLGAVTLKGPERGADDDAVVGDLLDTLLAGLTTRPRLFDAHTQPCGEHPAPASQ